LKGLLGKKLGMSQIFTEDGKMIPVTVINAGPCVVVRKRTKDKDGYSAIQLGWGDIIPTRLNKPQRKYFEKNNLKPVRFLLELRVDDPEKYNVGEEINVDIFKPGERVDVRGTSKGKGFAGTMKRWNFHGGPASHGSMTHRQPAAAGSTDAARVIKGKRSPGRLGGVRRTVQGLQVIRVDREKNLILVKGSIPGPSSSLVLLTESVK